MKPEVQKTVNKWVKKAKKGDKLILEEEPINRDGILAVHRTVEKL